MLKNLLAFAFLFSSSVSMAWHSLGHRTTATIALTQLSTLAQTQVKNLLKSEDFADASNWPDSIKGTVGWKHTSPYHYASIPDGVSYLQNLARLPIPNQNKGDLVLATFKSILTLRNPQADQQTKYLALKFLIHFMGDLQQPLHAGRPEDQGGNKISLNWFGKMVHLHDVWDGLMIQTAYADQLGKVKPEDQNKWLAAFLINKYPQARRLKCDIDVLGWFNQTMSYRASAYTGYDTNNPAYLQRNLPIVETQMLLGGHRLACVLNLVFANPAVLTAQEKQLYQYLNLALKRDFYPLIQLVPVNARF